MNHSKLYLFSSFLLYFSIFYAYSSPYSFNNSHTRCSFTQTHALLQFKQNLFSYNHSYDANDDYDYLCDYWLGSDYYPIMMNWNMSIDCCNWDGVTCDHSTGDVIALDLSCGMLRGTIHPNSTLFNLSHLQKLNLAYNKFTNSQLLHEIGRFSNSLTHLNISYCGLTDKVSMDITILRKLVSLDLSFNFNLRLEPRVFYNLLRNSTSLEELSLISVNISLILPTSLNIFSSLKSLRLRNTGLLGKLPDNIFNLPYLEELDLSDNNNLTCRFPKVNTSINIPLKWLDLSSTNLSGEIFDSIGHLKSLNTLGLNSNGLMGPLPKSLVNLRHLATLDLSSNNLNGTLPSWLFTLPSLESIDLSYNMFSGSLPSELFNHRSLKRLKLGGNQFVGEIDMVDQGSTVQAFWKFINLTSLDLSFNNFIGVWELDTLLSRLTNITYLRLSYSGLSVVTNNDTHYVNPNFFLLDLASCKLKVFPKSLQAMKNLKYLDLSENEIHGYIPDWAGEIGGNNLRYLNLSQNFITSLPQFSWDGLMYLDLQSNQIEGAFPSSICNMRFLQLLDMSNNSFGGVIPQCLGNIGSFLQMVDLRNNRFHGTIPNTWDDCGGLDALGLNGNSLEGEVPSGLSKCESLKVLDLGNNHLNGTFPHWSAHLPHLQVLVLKSNKFHGPIETSSMIELPFQSLRVMDLSHNNFVGHLPPKYFQNFKSMKDVVNKNTGPQYLGFAFKFYSTTLVVKGLELLFSKILQDYMIINLSNNSFEGEIPDVIGSLNSLKVLNLSHNNLNGGIPNALGNLLEIESLDLSWNRLTGEIPQSLAGITNLGVLNLSQNHLVGRIPSGTQFSTFSTSFGGNPRLCGFPLPKHCEHASIPQLEADEDEDEESGFTWKVVTLGSGCGTIIGLVLGYVMLSTGRPKWFNAIADDIEYMVQRRQKKRRYIYIGK